MKKISLFLSCFVLLGYGKAQMAGDVFVKNVDQPVISLNGDWKINLHPAGKFWDTQNFDDWDDIQVPGECMMQGFPIKHDEAFAYKKQFGIPCDFDGKAIKLRFEGVYSYARVWVNGQYIRDHHGGFTSWECDITSAVNPGEMAVLTLEVTDRADEISFASGYAKHPIGGILRNVSLLAVPENYPEQIRIITDLDKDFLHAEMTVEGIIINRCKDLKVFIELYSPKNVKIKLLSEEYKITNGPFQIKNRVNNPLKWDAEHPNLYKLKLSLSREDTVLWSGSYRIGFREIEIQKNKFLVNGRQVKLRGADRHDIHPLLGRVSTPDYELKDVLLAKEANMNFIRTSHYPPSDNFLKLCDEYGIYVEDETAVCFVGTHRTKEYRPGDSENKPEFESRYLSQLEEMVVNHRNHPCIIIWSIGNENSYGINFKKSYDWVKAADPSRPVIFSYPGKVPEGTKTFDLLSMHYPGIYGNMEQYGIITESFSHADYPALFDEWAHVACYNNLTVIEDPNVRDFWGISLDSMWQKVYDSEGALGGAIWGMIDETFMLPLELPGFNEWWGIIDENIIPAEYKGHTIGYGEWGIVDTWRRKKPEFWNVKKAYSPVRILQTSFEQVAPESTLQVPVYNRFDFKNLNEITISYTCEGTRMSAVSPDVPAHTRGVIQIPLADWPDGEPLIIEFLDPHHGLIDRYRLQNKGTTPANPSTAVPRGTMNLTEREDVFEIQCDNNLSIFIDRNTGLINGFETGGRRVGFSGPCLNLRTKGEEIIYSAHRMNEYGENWELKNMKIRENRNFAEVILKGSYEKIKNASFHIRIYPDGSISTSYTVSPLPNEYLRELGLKFIMEDNIDSLSWKRDAYWSDYPDQHLSAVEGKVGLYNPDPTQYREAPVTDWNQDTKNFYYEGTGPEKGNNLTYSAKSTKVNILEYCLHMNGIGTLTVAGSARESCRLGKKESCLELFINNQFDYPDLGWGNYQKNILPGRDYSGEIRFVLPGIN